MQQLYLSLVLDSDLNSAISLGSPAMRSPRLPT